MAFAFCDEVDVNSLIRKINEFWRLRASEESNSDSALRSRLAEMADEIAAALEDDAQFFRTRAEFLRTNVT